MKEMRFKVKGVFGSHYVEKDREGKHEGLKMLRKGEEYGGMRLRVLGVPIGGPVSGRDSDGEAFTERSKLWLTEGEWTPVTYYHGFGPDDPMLWQEDPAIIGAARMEKQDKSGWWFDVRLDGEEELALRVAKAMEEGMPVRASSGAAGHLVRVSDAGEIDVWPVAELAIFDTNEWRQPANEFAVVEAWRAETEEGVPEAAEAEKAKTAVDVPDVEVLAEGETKPKTGGSEMDENDVKMLAESIKAVVKEELEGFAPIAAKGFPAVVTELGDPDPKDAFWHYVRTGEKKAGLKRQWTTLATKAAMQEGTGAEGGYLVPDDFYPSVVAKRDEMSVARKLGVHVIPTSRDVIQVPYEDTSATNFAITAEEGAISQNEPTVGQLSLTVYKFTKLIKVSEELLEDEAAGLESWLADALARSWALTENAYVINGTGSGQPQGVLYGGTAGLTLDGTAAIAAAEIPELFHKLGSGYVEGGNVGWCMRNATLGYLRGLSGNPFYFMPMSVQAGPDLMGYPVGLSDSMGAIGASAKTLVVGNWWFYKLAERRGLYVRRLNELYAGNGQVGILATVRFGGGVAQAEAFQYATQHS